MKMDKLATALRRINKLYGLDMTDLIILDDIAQKMKHKKSVTIMEIVESSEAASPATVHARIKRMCDHNILHKIIDENNLRFRMLDFGAPYSRLVEELGQV